MPTPTREQLSTGEVSVIKHRQIRLETYLYNSVYTLFNQRMKVIEILVVLGVKFSDELEDQTLAEHELFVAFNDIGQEKGALPDEGLLLGVAETFSVFVDNGARRVEEEYLALDQINGQGVVGDGSNAVHLAVYLAFESDFADGSNVANGLHSRVCVCGQR